MPEHTIVRTSRGTIQTIRGTCGSDECPVEEADVDDGTITYRCPVTDEVIESVDTEPVDEEPANKPSTMNELRGARKRPGSRRR